MFHRPRSAKISSMTLHSTIDRPARLVSRKKIRPTIYCDTFHLPAIARRAKPGQFVQIRAGSGFEPFFRRPMSIFAADSEGGTIDILYAVVGTGTRHLAALRKGDEIPIFGPLGNWFILPRGCRQVILVAGGVGLPPLVYFARAILQNRRRPPEILLLAGSRANETRLQIPATVGVRRLWCTDDGSFGYHGTVMGLLTSLHAEDRWPVESTAVYGCGPTPMLAALQQWLLNTGYPGQLSLEEMMPCGFGVCSGCAVKAGPAATGYDTYKRVCHDGPIFDVREVQL